MTCVVNLNQHRRRQKIATVLLKACDVLSALWGFSYLALRAHEDDFGARKLYSNAGYKVVSRDPIWITWIGKKRRVLMVKPSPFYKTDFIWIHNVKNLHLWYFPRLQWYILKAVSTCDALLNLEPVVVSKYKPFYYYVLNM